MCGTIKMDCYVNISSLISASAYGRVAKYKQILKRDFWKCHYL